MHRRQVPHVHHDGPRGHHGEYILGEGVLVPEGVPVARVEADGDGIDGTIKLQGIKGKVIGMVVDDLNAGEV